MAGISAAGVNAGRAPTRACMMMRKIATGWGMEDDVGGGLNAEAQKSTERPGR